MQRLKNFIWHPLTGLAVGIGTLGQFGFAWFEPIWGLIVATSSYWFPAVATSSSTLLPELGYGDLGTRLLIAAASVFVAVQIDRLYERAQEYLENR
ncbi:hypothetical protein GOC74_12130 [Halomicrobium mukohataei]|uniref:Uncharacterized protein n=1 Tax=Halomicrobium mukohataei TaxID=57705 RepID=A0A847U4R1_9EURY|nr:hypothetical protein [Halomicrobium mukohataei]NLV10673.1 hypothetical protein [Halomicrobium mukohataei]